MHISFMPELQFILIYVGSILLCFFIVICIGTYPMLARPDISERTSIANPYGSEPNLIYKETSPVSFIDVIS